MTVFEAACVAAGIGKPESEYKFAPPRKWAFDYCWPSHMVALEVEGGIWKQGRHNRASGFIKDLEKYNQAACLGWRLIRCTTEQFESGEIINTLVRAMLPTQ